MLRLPVIDASTSLQAIDGIHQVGVYCLALVPSNTLPKTPLGGIHLSETKQLFLEGALHPCNVLLCPHTCVTNLPKPRQKQPGEVRRRVGKVDHLSRWEESNPLPPPPLPPRPEIGPASVMVGNLVSGKRIAQASGRDLSQIEDNDQARKVCVRKRRRAGLLVFFPLSFIITVKPNTLLLFTFSSCRAQFSLVYRWID